MILYLDLETYSDVDLRKHSVHRYCEGAVEVLLTAWAVDENPVQVDEGWPEELNLLVDEADEIVIHNSKFDRTVLAAIGVTIPVEKIHDTLVQARMHGLPGALGTLCDIFRLPTDKAKDKRGKQLIQLFCKPRPKRAKIDRATKDTHPEEWAEFVEYADSDVEAMREIRKRLPRWNLTEFERDLWLLDQKVNDRGFAVDLGLAQAAINAVNEEQRRLSEDTSRLTYAEVEAATQRDALLKHIVEFYDVDLPDMQKGTLERRLQDEGLPSIVRELLSIRLEASGTSTAKYQTLINVTSSDGRLRGALEYCGAARTGRWAGRGLQPQNLPRPQHKRAETDQFIEALHYGTADLLFDDIIARASSAIRGAIIAPTGRKLVVADLSNIEGRVLAWLADEHWKLDAFRDFDKGIGHDLYKLAYSRSFGVPPASVTPEQRQLGKVQELALGYQGAVGAFTSMAQLYGMELPEEEILALVKAWRKANSNIANLWWETERTAVKAIEMAGKTFEVGRVRIRCDGAWLRLVLPSGRALVYPQPRLLLGGACDVCEGTGELHGELDGEMCQRCMGSGKEREDKPRIAFSGINPYTRQWGRVVTYGGKLVENITQATARDVLADSMLRAEEAGYEIVLTVHDELVTETPDAEEFSAEGLSAIMATNPPWAKGLPLAAAGFEARRYGKE